MRLCLTPKGIYIVWRGQNVTKGIKISANNKSYVTKDIKNITNTRKMAFIYKDVGVLKETEKELKTRLREAKLTQTTCQTECGVP